MDIEIIEPCGYSKTLSNLLDVANKARYSFPKSQIVLLGSVLNGEQVKVELNKLGINIVDIPYEGFEDYLKNVDPETLIITSPYGTEEKLFKCRETETDVSAYSCIGDGQVGKSCHA